MNNRNFEYSSYRAGHPNYVPIQRLLVDHALSGFFN